MAGKNSGTIQAIGTAPAAKVERQKKVCPVTYDEFVKSAKPHLVTIDGITFCAVPKRFSTGSYGYHACGKFTEKIGDVAVEVQVGVQLTLIGSKLT